MQTVNIPLLRKAVEWAEAEALKPVEFCRWEQGDWVTGTQELAWAAVQFKRAQGDGREVNDYISRLAQKDPACGTCYCVAGFVVHEILGTPLGSTKYRLSGSYAADAGAALGITPVQAEQLFEGSNSIEDIRRIAEEIAGEKL